ncbi:MAG: class I SAM-dependent methyltransferase [Ignavibacteria bacterium]|jgi:SAM-dependent methyltransferase|nr:class I SAM-dependent methyltransferase [Ignavibacteria bacterium]MCU7502964.1 class I SAM-dependent methyltransferase [Ignavibacteria bacterium]MCU7517053.1 class I SAM-dependent methyltransferase [Ignavibacteria bacterium]
MFHAFLKQLKRPSGLLGIIVARMMESRNRKYYDKAISFMEIKNGERIFEIGYGPGVGIELLARNYGCYIAGIDFSDLMYKKATERNKEFIDAGKVDLKYGNLLDSDLDSAKYDKVFCLNVIYFWNDLNKAFMKVSSLLNDNGIYFIYMTTAEELTRLGFDKEFFKYSVEQVESALRQAGFNKVEYEKDNGYYIKAWKC